MTMPADPASPLEEESELPRLRELGFDRMIEQGLADVDAGRVLSHEELVREILTWSK